MREMQEEEGNAGEVDAGGGGRCRKEASASVLRALFSRRVMSTSNFLTTYYRS